MTKPYLTLLFFCFYISSAHAVYLEIEDANGRTQLHDMTDVGYAYEAGQWCKHLQFNTILTEEAASHYEFKIGKNSFQTATKLRSVQWACDTAQRTSKSLLNIVP